MKLLIGLLLLGCVCACGQNRTPADELDSRMSGYRENAFDRVQKTKEAVDQRKRASGKYYLIADRVSEDDVLITATDEDASGTLTPLGHFKVVRGGPVLVEDAKTSEWVAATPAIVGLAP